jgi:RNA polymerase sigma-70 factor (ECF subfamily)
MDIREKIALFSEKYPRKFFAYFQFNRLYSERGGVFLQIDELVRKHENRIYRTAIAIMGNKSDAEDVMQDVFLKILEKSPVFESDEHETAWLVRVTVNRCKTILRSNWFKKSQSLHDTCPSLTQYTHDTPNSLIDTVNTLPKKYRIVIYLYYYEGYSTKEIAEITKQKEPTVRSQLARARKMLKTYLEEED